MNHLGSHAILKLNEKIDRETDFIVKENGCEFKKRSLENSSLKVSVQCNPATY